MALAIDPLIRLAGVSKVFHAEEVETHALSRIDLEIRAGECVAVCGPSGCGKTTLLSVLGLLDSPSEGSYVLAGEPVATLSPAQRARVRSRAIGFIFQSFNLIGDLDVYHNVELPLKYRGLDAPERRALVHEALERVGLLHRIRHYPSQLSGGPAAARRGGAGGGGQAPGAAGRRAHRQSRFAQRRPGHGAARRAQRRGATVVIVTHDPRYLGRTGRSVFLFDGKIVPRGSIDREVA